MSKDGKKFFWSKAGREVLIKAVFQTTLVYTMSIFLLTDNLRLYYWNCNEFLVEPKQRKISMTWRRWDKLCQLNLKGRIDFKDLRAFNLDLLANKSWQLLTDTGSLLSKVFKAKYYPYNRSKRMSNREHMHHTYRIVCWKACSCSNKERVRWRVGNSTHILVLTNPKLPRLFNFKPLLYQTHSTSDLKVADLMLSHMRRWNVPRLHQILDPFFSELNF